MENRGLDGPATATELSRTETNPKVAPFSLISTRTTATDLKNTHTLFLSNLYQTLYSKEFAGLLYN
jgi:hypothetical protein